MSELVPTERQGALENIWPLKKGGKGGAKLEKLKDYQIILKEDTRK